MMNSRLFGGLSFGWHLHWFFGTLLFVGVVLLIVWMVKNLNKKDLLNWIVILIVAGVVGSVLTMNYGMKGWKYMMSDKIDFDGVVDID